MKKTFTKEEATEKLKKYWKVDELTFIAQYIQAKDHEGNNKVDKNGNEFGFFKFFKSNDRTLLYPNEKGYEYDKKIDIFYKPNNGIKHNVYYNVHLEIENDKKRTENPFMLKVKGFSTANPNVTSPKEFIKDWFNIKGESPHDASTIAGQLKLNELELYTETERFFFELLQNADDMPVQNFVDVKVRLLNDHLAFMHNGQHFQRKHVEAIADAAKSSKKGDSTKTGYKGIGFKSVFSDSQTVYIKSSDYSFKFDKSFFANKTFDEIYEWYFNSKIETERTKQRNQYNGKEDIYTNIDNIPWQIKPIWVERNEYPVEISKISEFTNRNLVSFFLNIGNETIIEKEYENKISKLLKEPRFLLFLRHVRSINYNEGNTNEISINVTKSAHRISISSNRSKEDIQYIPFSSEVQINNNNIKNAGFSFIKEENGTSTRFHDNGIELRRIPEKIKSLSITEINFAAKVIDGKIQSLSDNESILFNYLPTSDKRFAFPILVNGDFITGSNREYIQQENKWNHFLMYNIGYALIKWTQELATLKHPQYSNLNVIPELYLNEEDDKIGEISKAFNRGIKSGFKDFSFIINNDNRASNPDRIIADFSDFRSLLGDDCFLNILGSNKSLINNRCDLSIEKAKLLGIESISKEIFIKHLFSERGLSIFNKHICNLNLSQHRTILAFINDNADKITELGYDINILPLFTVSIKGDKGVTLNAYTISEILNNQRVLLQDNEISVAKEILTSLRFKVLPYNIDDYQELKKNLNLQDSYLIKKDILFNRVKERENLANISPEQKIELINFLLSLDNIGEKKCFAELRLFNSVSGVAFPLNELVSNEINNQWLDIYKISKDEEIKLGKHKVHIASSTNIYSRFIADDTKRSVIYSKFRTNNIEQFSNDIYTYYNADKTSDKKHITELPVIWDGTKFKTSNHFCFNIRMISEIIEYSQLKEGIEIISKVCLPDILSISLIRKINNNNDIQKAFQWESSSFINSLCNNGELSEVCINQLFRYMLSFDTKELLFEKGYFIENNNVFNFNISKSKQYHIESNQDLDKYINNNTDRFINWKQLPESIYNKDLAKLGLSSEKDIIKDIISAHTLYIDFSNIALDSGKTNGKEWLLRFISESSINLNTEKEYLTNSPEYSLIKFAIEELDATEIIKLREIISVDNIPAKELNFKNNTSTNLVDFSLNDLIPNNTLNSNKHALILKCFPSELHISLENSIFTTNSFPTEEIISQIEKQEDTLNSEQLYYVFILAAEKSEYEGRVNNLKISTLDGEIAIKDNISNIWYIEGANYIKDCAILSSKYANSRILESTFLDPNPVTKANSIERKLGKHIIRRKPYLSSNGNIKVCPIREAFDHNEILSDIFNWFINSNHEKTNLLFEQEEEKSLEELIGFKPSDYIWNKEFALKSETLPCNILDLYDNNKRSEDFFKALGVNMLDSSIVSIRKAFNSINKSDFEQNYYSIKDTQPKLIGNTIIWGQEKIKLNPNNYTDLVKSFQEKVSYNESFPIYTIGKDDSLVFKNITSESEVISLANINDSEYILKLSEYYLDKNAVILSDNNHKNWIYNIQPKTITIQEKKVDSIKLSKNSIKLNNEIWNTFENKDKYSIYQIDNQIPYLIKHENLILKEFEEGHSTKINGNIYINSKYHEILELVKENLSTDDKIKFEKHISEYNKNKAQSLIVLDAVAKDRGYNSDDIIAKLKDNPDLLDYIMKQREENLNISEPISNAKWDKYNEDFHEYAELLKGNEELEKDIQKSIHLEALFIILSHLDNNYSCDFSKINSDYGCIRNININGANTTIIPRSACRGILYITPSQWKEFQKENTWIIYTANNSVVTKKTRDELVDKNDYMMTRVNSKSSLDFINFLPSGGDAQLLFPSTEEMRKRLFK